MDLRFTTTGCAPIGADTSPPQTHCSCNSFTPTPSPHQLQLTHARACHILRENMSIIRVLL